MRAGLLGLLLAALLWAAPARAAELVGNPGPVTLTLEPPGGEILGASPEAFSAPGAVDAEGNLLFPAGDLGTVEFPVPGIAVGGITIDSGGLLELTPTEDVTGTIDPAAGAVELTGPLEATLSVVGSFNPGIGGTISFIAECDVGSAALPVELSLGTAPLGSGYDTPVAYDQQTGEALLIGATSVPPLDADACEFSGDPLVDLVADGLGPLVLGAITDSFDGAPVAARARFEPAPRAREFVPPVEDPGPTSPGPSTPGGPLLPSSVFTIGRMGSSAGGVGTLVLTLPGPGVVSALATANVKAGAARKVTVARGTKTVTKAGRLTLRLRPSRKAKTVLRRKGRLRARVKVTYTPTGGSPRSSTRALTFKLKRRRR